MTISAALDNWPPCTKLFRLRGMAVPRRYGYLAAQHRIIMVKLRFYSRRGPSLPIRGFTLVELLVVIAVIAILAALLMPALARARSKGQGMTCINNLRQLSIACFTYTDDARDRLPYNLGHSDIYKAVSRNYYYNWTTPVMNWELDSDNTNRVLLTRGGIGPYVSKVDSVYRCPADRVLSDLQVSAGWVTRVRSISMNAMAGDAGEYTRSGSNVNNPGYKQYFKLGQILHPVQTFLFIDEHPDSINDGYFLNTHNSGKWTDLPASYHDGGANLTFADGHAERKTWRFTSTKPPARPDAARLPFKVPSSETGDFDWLMQRTSEDAD